MSPRFQHIRRLFQRTPIFAITIIIMLAVGIGAVTAIFSLVNAVLIRPLPYADADRLVAVHHVASKFSLPFNGVSPGMFLYYQSRSHAFEALGFYLKGSNTLRDNDAPEQVGTVRLSPSVFSVLRNRPFLGRLPTNDDVEATETSLLLRTSALISYDLWKRRYGMDPGVIGRPIRIGNSRSIIIVGVAEPGFHFPDPSIEVWIAGPPEVRTNRGRASLRGMSEHAVARLRNGVSVEEAERDLQQLIGSLPDVFPDVREQGLADIGLRAQVVPFKREIVGEVRVPLLLLLTTTAFLLLITWANTTNLCLIRAERLRREVAVARALGASNRDLRHRFLPESFALALIGGMLSLALASIAIGTQFGFQSDQIPRLNELRMDATTVIFVLILTSFSGLLLGSVALISARRVDASGALMGSFGRASSRPDEQRWRRLLVVTQVALALPLLIGSTLMAKSFFNLIHVDLGFQPGNGLTFTLPIPPTNAKSGDYYHDVAEIHSRVLDRLRALPGVDAAEATTFFPLTIEGNDVRVAGNREDNVENVAYAGMSYATPDYFRVMGIPILTGRAFQTNDLTVETPGAILSASLARSLFGREDVVGKQVHWPGESGFLPHTVVGVVGDIAAKSITDGPSRLLYFPHIYPPRAEKVTGVISIFIPDVQRYIVRTHLPVASLSQPIHQIVREIDPTLVVTEVSTVQQRVDDSMARARLTMLLLAIGAGTALFLGLTGLYGVLAYAVGQRTPEFGIRIALGASPAMIVRMVIRQGVILAFAGIAIGTLVAVWLSDFLRSLLYQVSPTDPAAFALASAFMVAVAALASYLPAHRAGKTDTFQALKAE